MSSSVPNNRRLSSGQPSVFIDQHPGHEMVSWIAMMLDAAWLRRSSCVHRANYEPRT